MKTKVVLAITKARPWGGAQKYVYDLATNLPKEQFDVAVILGGQGELSSRLELAGIRTISIASMQRDIRLSADLASLVACDRALRREKPDVLHLSSSKARRPRQCPRSPVRHPQGHLHGMSCSKREARLSR